MSSKLRALLLGFLRERNEIFLTNWRKRPHVSAGVRTGARRACGPGYQKRRYQRHQSASTNGRPQHLNTNRQPSLPEPSEHGDRRQTGFLRTEVAGA
jgi:hypothetical protein